MNGAEALLATLVEGGVEVVFANPGTSEMHLVAAIDRQPRLRPVLGLFEGVVTGAADGYARMSGKAAASLLHLGPGLGNGFANIHNARRAHSPMLNIVGDHAGSHLPLDAPLSTDLDGLAGVSSHFVCRVDSAAALPGAGAQCLAAANSRPGQIATLLVQADAAWGQAQGPAAPLTPKAPPRVGEEVIARAADALAAGGSATGLLLGGQVLGQEGLELAGRIAAATGARLISDTFVARQARGAGRVQVERLPYFAEQAGEFLHGLRHLVPVGTKPPVAFFAYPDVEGRLTPPGCEILQLASEEEDALDALGALADVLGGDRVTGELRAGHALPEEPPRGDLNLPAIGGYLARLLPEGAVVADESCTSGAPLLDSTATAAPHDWLYLTGGSIGQGLPLATGAAIACPDRQVICLHGDGGAMYTVQALWTQARENLDVVTVIFANHRYLILDIELGRVGAGATGAAADSLFSLGSPRLDWVQLAAGMGVPGGRADTAEQFGELLQRGLASAGPFLIEALI